MREVTVQRQGRNLVITVFCSKCMVRTQRFTPTKAAYAESDLHVVAARAVSAACEPCGCEP